MIGGFLRAPGQHSVDAPIVCSLTRFGLRSPRQLLPSYRDYRCVARAAQAAGTPGLQHCAFLVENPTTFHSLSIWDEEVAIAHFGTNVPEHVSAAGKVIGRLAFDPNKGPEIWSTKWRLMSVSHNLNWGDFDLRGLILEDGH